MPRRAARGQWPQECKGTRTFLRKALLQIGQKRRLDDKNSPTSGILAAWRICPLLRPGKHATTPGMRVTERRQIVIFGQFRAPFRTTPSHADGHQPGLQTLQGAYPFARASA